MWDGNLWDFPIQLEEQKPEKFLFDGEMLQWLKTSFITWLLGWPNLECQRLGVLEEETPSQVTKDQLTMKDKRDEEEKLENQKKKK